MEVEDGDPLTGDSNRPLRAGQNGPLFGLEA